jgi:hypothetical protein
MRAASVCDGSRKCTQTSCVLLLLRCVLPGAATLLARTQPLIASAPICVLGG